MTREQTQVVAVALEEEVAVDCETRLRRARRPSARRERGRRPPWRRIEGKDGDPRRSRSSSARRWAEAAMAREAAATAVGERSAPRAARSRADSNRKFDAVDDAIVDRALNWPRWWWRREPDVRLTSWPASAALSVPRRTTPRTTRKRKSGSRAIGEEVDPMRRAASLSPLSRPVVV